MIGHPSPAELAAFFRRELSSAQARSICRHLRRMCPDCLALLASCVNADAFQAALAEAVPEEPDSYDDVIARVLESVRKQERHVRAQEKQAKEILARFEKGDELAAAENLPSSTGMYAKYLAFLERSWTLRHEDPGRMVQHAIWAVACARRLDPRKYGDRQVVDFQCKAHAALANANRVAQRLADAEALMARAWRLFELGTRDETLEIYLLEFEAALDADRRRFKKAIDSLQRVYRHHRRLGQKHLAARALIQMAAYTTYSGDVEKALTILDRSLSLLDATADPTLVYMARHNRIWILCDCGRFREAERELFELRPFHQHSGGRISALKVRWLEGRIDAGRERFDRAVETLCEVREELGKVHRAYDAALASIDLAAVLMARAKYIAAAEVVNKAHDTFRALGIDREGLVSLKILKEAFARQLATQAMVEEVAAFLRKLEVDPEAKFAGSAWGW
ncbi:MAG TPA: hypothetical protein VGX68_13975 [Thermoanaerobaculia bacterium]|jgi:tetratricopeptide (TPR) repeat protein|nr:hypothetical protein [Thermoanaerobaculia bacterium]